MKNHMKKKCMCFIVMAGVFLLVVLFAQYLVPYAPDAQDFAVLEAPSFMHICGTDRMGRDMLARIMAGLKTSVLSALLLTTVITITGTVCGVVAGHMGGVTDAVLMRIADICLAFPGIVFAMGIAALLGGGMHNAILALSLVSWPKYARLARNETLAIENRDYIKAAKLTGATSSAIIIRHVLPNMAGVVLVTAMLDIGTMMMEIAGLSFLGLGAMPPVAELGNMIREGRSMLQTFPWVVFGPGIALFVAVMVFNLSGDALRDYLDPAEK